MASAYFYSCSACAHQFTAEDIENNFVYLCPDCGSAEDNQPLRGVLKLEYDYDALKNTMSREHFFKLQPGRPWLYPELWPFKNMTTLVPETLLDQLRVPDNCVFQTNLAGQDMFILDDTRNPTFSYKDRASVIVALKAIEKRIADVSVASTGNAGSSLAGIAARMGLTAHIWVSENIPRQKLAQIQAYGAQVHIVRGNYDNAFDLNRRIAAAHNWYDRNTAYNPLTIEGKKSAAYDIFIARRGQIPENIFIPVGDGAIIGGVYKGFSELLQLGWIDRLPRLIAVQAAGSDALYRYMAENQFTYTPPQTIADGISAGAPRNLYMAATALKESNGQVVRVSDEEILSAQQQLACRRGYLVEPAAAASLAGFLKLKTDDKIHTEQKYMLLLTGNGLKDTESVSSWLESLPVRDINEWLQFYAMN